MTESDKRKEFESNRNTYLAQLPNECGNCGSTSDLDIHHIVPLSLGGSNRLGNLSVMCAKCHGLVHGKDFVNAKRLQREGIRKAKDNGVSFGRPSVSITDEFIAVYKRWKDGELTAVAAIKEANIGKTSFYKLVKEYEKEAV